MKSRYMFRYFEQMMKAVLLLLFVSLMACEEEKRVIEPFVPGGTRVILLEEFTGKGCINCPKGSREIENLLALFPDNLVAVSIHAGFFADPVQFPLGIYDLRSPEGDEILNLLGAPVGYPAGVVNRTRFSGSMQLGANQWASAISKELETEPAVDLSITKDFDPVTRELNVTATVIGKEAVSGDLRLSIMLTESGIVDAQEDSEAPSTPVPDYVHRHVLRTMMTPATGVSILSAIAIGQSYSQSFTTTLPADWNAANMEIIAFVSNFQGSTFPILQAASAHLSE